MHRPTNTTPQQPAAWRVAAWCLLIALPLLGISAKLADLLGTMHFHSTPSAGLAAMNGWQDLRRVDHLTDRPLAPHSHSALGRHHHAADDSTAVALGSEEHDGDTGTSAGASFVFVAMLSSEADPPVSAAASAGWCSSRALALQSCDGQRLERPPKA